MTYLAPEIILRIKALPCFSDPQEIQPLGGGITNVNVTVRDGDARFVVRLGEDIPEHGVMRWNELALSRAAADAGLSPHVRHAEPGVMVIDYVEAAPLSGEDLHDPAQLIEATQLVRRLHRDMPHHLQGPVLAFNVFHVLRSYAGFLRDKGSGHVPLLARLMDEAAQLEQAVGKVDLVLGHNDLLPANLLRDSDRLWLVDWEYGGFASPLFDLGGLASNADLPPDAEALMLATYFEAHPDEATMASYGAMKCASALRETMWSMVSEITSKIDFDYADYTAQNLNSYRQSFADYFQTRGQL